jgi:nucleotide-binding universal stress UspA family protein
MFKKILVPLDGSKLAEGILSQVESLAKIHDSEITLLRVALAHLFSVGDPVENESIAIRKAEEYLAGVEARLKSSGLKVTSVVHYGNGAQEITDYARDFHFDLVAMSTHGRSGFGQFVLGSVAIKILHVSTVPIFLFRPQS